MREPKHLEALFPNRDSSETLVSQLSRKIRAAIEAGIFPLNSKILPSRELAVRLGVSRNTVTDAIEDLIADGYLETRLGAGTFVTMPLRVVEQPAHPTREWTPALARFASAKVAFAGFNHLSGPLRVGMPDVAKIPLSAWRSAQRRVPELTLQFTTFGSSAGMPPLRHAIAAHVRQFRGISTHPDHIIVTDGAQEAFHLLAFALASPGDRVAIEDPCYLLAKTIFDLHRLEIVPVRADESGLCVEKLPKSARFVYTTPSHQFPLGGALPIDRRNLLLQWADESDAYVIEDDYDSEFSIGRPLPALQSLDRNERVIYIGTFSKSLAPGIRLAYIVAPPHVAQMLKVARIATRLGNRIETQLTLAHFMADGHLARHIRKMTRDYNRRRRALLDVLHRELPSGYVAGPAHTGLHVAVVCPSDVDDEAIAATLPRGGRILPLSILCLERPLLRGFVLGFASASADEVERAASEFCAALRNVS